VRSGDGFTFELTLTHQQIATRIGSVREVVSRAFTRLAQQSLVTTRGRLIIIPSEGALAGYASQAG
ncbi:MAG: helix-turn-helix domain-containing protein, partial [Bryobacteraceae bacterium]